jgi:hypothetical protein
MNSLSIERDSNNKIVAISRHISVGQISRLLAIGIGLLALGYLLFEFPPGHLLPIARLKMQFCSVLLMGFGIYCIALCGRRIFSPSKRDIRVAGVTGLNFFYYDALETVPWSDVCGFTREKSPRKLLGKELLVVQLANSEKYLARIRARPIQNSFMPGGKMALPFATLATSSIMDLDGLEDGLRQLIAQRNIVLSPAAPKIAAEAVRIPRKSRLLQVFLMIALVVSFSIAMTYRRIYGIDGLRHNYGSIVAVVLTSLVLVWVSIMMLRRRNR